MNVYKFPFDTQNCSVIIGSWFHSLNIIKLKIGNLSPMDLDPTKYIDIIRNPIWNLIRFNANIVKSKRLASSIEEYYDTYFTAIIKRNPLYYMINSVYPYLILNVITLLTFFLPFALQASLSKILILIKIIFIFIKHFKYFKQSLHL